MSHKNIPFNFGFAGVFLAFIVCLTIGYYSLPDSLTNNYLVQYFAVLPSVHVIDWLTPNQDIYTQGTHIISLSSRLNINKGCEGIEMLLLFYAAILASFKSVFRTASALLLGTLIIFFLNQFRIASLFFISAYEPMWFNLAHGFVAPVFIISTCSVYFFYWYSKPAPNIIPTQ